MLKTILWAFLITGVILVMLIGIVGLKNHGESAPVTAAAVPDAPLARMEAEQRALRGIVAKDFQTRLLGRGFDVQCALGGTTGEKLLITGPGLTRPFAYKLAAEKTFLRSLESAGFTEVDFFGPNYTGGVEKLSLHPSQATARQRAFDSVMWAKKEDVASVRRIVEQAKPSLRPGDFEFLSAYVGIIEKGYYGMTNACRVEGLARFHSDFGPMRALEVKPGQCVKDASRAQGLVF